ncbi:ATP-binding protein [Pseudonocardia eucalypti]|uniref:histidine kinase n=1 Tax=Pseudonocardia eucalypti TaxID=648755 RepID=A0ABP9QGV0_9PSEU|nr:signal transduction histidine kinase [Pseudonocardia eucalypti]
MQSAPTGPRALTAYKVLRVLKEGQAYRTLLALDRQTGVRVVIKAIDLATLSTESRDRLERESSLLQGLRAASIATVIDIFREAEKLYVVAPYVAGVTLRSRMAAGRLSVPEALTVAADLLRSLAELHERGLIHRDVRPANVMVNERPPVYSATLVDFGLVSESFLNPTRPTRSPRYMSPELAGVLERAVDCRSDLYSVGIVLYECLAGRPPFDSEDTREVLRQHLSAAPSRLRTLGVPIPQALEEILHRLLHKDPDDRYHSARAALADVEAVGSALRSGIAEPGVAVGAHDWRQTLTEPSLTGREGELEFLLRRLADAARGSAGLVIVEAHSGGGKTRVLDEFCERASALDARIFRGRGIERSARHPLHMLAGVVGDLVEQAGADPGFGPELARGLGGAVGPLSDALPELRQVFGGDDQPTPRIPESQVQSRLASALMCLLEALGGGERAAVVVLDDCQWADELTLGLLTAWAESVAGGSDARHLLVVAAMRSEEVGPHRRLSSLEGAEVLPLPPLEPSQVGQVVESMGGKIPATATRVVAELSRGNPLMISAVLRGLVEVGALAPSGDGWRFTPVSGGWQASRESAAFLASRFALLAAPTRRLLDAGAVLGREFDLEMAAALAGQDPAEAGEAIGQAVERHLVWTGNTGRLTFAHDRLRGSLLGELDAAELAELHRRAGYTLETQAPDRAFDIAYHFDAAGEPERAFPYAIRSAAQARERHDVELAERQYRIAERGMATADTGVRYELLEALGEILMLRGRYDEAAERFEGARGLATDNMQVAWMEGQLGELLFRWDNLDAAAEHIESGLSVLGEWVPTGGQRKLLFRLLWELVRRLARGVARHRTVASADPAVDRLKSHLYTRLQYPRWFHARRVEGLCMMVRQVNVAERCPGSAELAHAYSVWGGSLALTFPFLWRRGLRYVDRASRIYRDRGDSRGEGHAASMRTCVLHGAGRYREAVESAGEAIRILSQFGDRWEVGFAARNRAVCLYRLGRLREAWEQARRVYEIGLEVGDANAQVTALDVLARTTGGQVPAAQTEAAVARHGDDIEVAVAALHADALRLRHGGRLEEAIDSLERAARLVGRAQPTSTHLVPVFAWLATLHREAAERPLLPQDRRRLLRRARASARRAVRYGRIYPNDLPHAQRELGVVHALAGRRRRALRRLKRAGVLARRREAWAELAEVNRQRERLGFAAEDVSDVAGHFEASFSADREGQLSFGLADRFSALLEAGALLASCDSAAATVAAVRQVGRSLLRAERCRVAGFVPDWRPDTAAMPAGVRRAIREGRPLVITESADCADDFFDERSPIGARSALCAPVFTDDELAGYFLATHSRVDKLFGDEECRLAEFVARLAGAALERQRLHRDSRARVISAQEAERSRVARDLHDEIGQALTSVLLDVRSVESAVAGHECFGNEVEEVRRRVAVLRGGIGGALDSVQRLAFDLRPAVLDDLGLVAALRRLTTSTMTGDVNVELETVNLDDGDRLPADLETTAYRLVQEAVTNVVRHSRASTCGVILGRAQGRLRVMVEDDGIGFSPESQASVGLMGMRERAALVGGTLLVSSVPGQGTSVVFEVHLDG